VRKFFSSLEHVREKKSTWQATIGVLRAVRTLAFYNISGGAVLKLKIKKRGGVKHRIDAKVLEFGG
jgi:hypothetical protein